MAAQTKRLSRREERKAETREELIAAARTVFARHGFHGASVEQIAREAGYSTGAVYWHFSGKEDLFLAVFEAGAASGVRNLDSFLAHTEGDLATRTRAYADSFITGLRKRPEFMVLYLEFLVHAWRNPELREAFADRVASARTAAGRVLQEAADEKGDELRMPAEQMAAALVSLSRGVALDKLVDPEAFPDEWLGETMADLVSALVECPPAKRRARARK